MPLNNTDYSYHIKAVEFFIQSYGVHITPLIINSLRGKHTHVYRCHKKVILRNQVHWSMVYLSTFSLMHIKFGGYIESCCSISDC